MGQFIGKGLGTLSPGDGVDSFFWVSFLIILMIIILDAYHVLFKKKNCPKFSPSSKIEKSYLFIYSIFLIKLFLFLLKRSSTTGKKYTLGWGSQSKFKNVDLKNFLNVISFI